MSRFSDFLNGLTGSGAQPAGSLRHDQRRQRMADAAVSLADVRADAAAAEGRSPQPERPIHPGEILWEEYMKPLGLKAPTTAKAMGVPRTRIERLVAGQTALSPDTALRLSRA
ncbi:MAG: plasmid maintenance system antidote protein family, partial [Caulobacteraceae bacterium]|nr:plasmid maintenance system antidote protein family [Caulobacteraceae bacterium]